MIVAVIAMGMMGSAVGARLVANGATVRTSLSGRSGASAERARRAGITICHDETVFANADIVLSIVPPAVAVDVGRDIASYLQEQPVKPVFVDCNAIAPPSVARIALAMFEAEVPFVDAAIFGIPPKAAGAGPRFTVCGNEARRVLPLREFGLDIVDLASSLGAASSLKMCYGALTKGLTALGAAVTAGAESHGVSEFFRAEMLRSQPELAAWLDRQLPGMETKARRWAAELEENGVFLEDESPEAAAMFTAIAAYYESVAETRSV